MAPVMVESPKSRESLEKLSYIVISSYVVETLNTVTPKEMKEGEWSSPDYTRNSPNGWCSQICLPPPIKRTNFQ